MNKLFVIRDKLILRRMVAMVEANWEGMEADGKPLAVSLSQYRKTRSDEQNALMWVWFGKAAQQAWVGGRQYDAETWHEHCKRAFLPERNNKGDDKWKLLPNGDRLCVMSTTRLDTKEMSDYMNEVEAFIVRDLGVEIT